MRIIIEDSEPKGTAAAMVVGQSTYTAMPSAIDAGQPRAGTTESFSAADLTGSTDAGTPPASLLQAIQNASSLPGAQNASSMNFTNASSLSFNGEANDAGGAPVN